MKVQFSTDHIHSFGGIELIHGLLVGKQVHSLIDRRLPTRAVQAQYQYSDAILSLLYSQLCGASSLEDLQLMREYFSDSPINIPSPDAFSYMCDELSVKNTCVNGSNGIVHELNIHSSLNSLLVELHLKTGVLKRGAQYDLDFDGVVLPNE